MNKNYHARPFGWYYLLLIATGLFLSACTTGLKVRSDVDPSASFSQYKTFNFFSPMGIEDRFTSPEFAEYYRAALSREMVQRNYQQADQPDLLINVTARIDDQVRIRSFTSPYMTGYYYNQPGGAYMGSGVGMGVSVGPRASASTEVSVFIDLVDTQKQRVVWQGVTVVNANEKVAQQLRDAIYTSVNRVLAQYPYTAGQ